jgi:hypothetical protein
VRSLVDRITITADAVGKGVTVRIEEDLAEMLAFAAAGQQNARQGLPDGRSTNWLRGRIPASSNTLGMRDSTSSSDPIRVAVKRSL